MHGAGRLHRSCLGALRSSQTAQQRTASGTKQVFSMSMNQETRDNNSKGLKRGADERSAKIHDYLVSKSYRPVPALDKLQEVSLQHKRGGMCSPLDSIPVLQLLCKLTSAKTAIEVGVFTGFTSLGIALALRDGGKLYGLDISEEYANIGKPYWEEAGVADRIDLRIGDAAQSLDQLDKELSSESVDLAFIDADKNNYDIYYEKLLKLVRPGGVIVFDNVIWNGSVIDEEDQSEDTTAIRAINTKLHGDSRVTIAMLKNSDGITVAMKN